MNQLIDFRKAADSYRRNYGEPPLLNGDFYALCAAVCDEISPLVRHNARFDDIRLLNLAAAGVRYTLAVREASSQGGAVSFKAGDVAVTSDFGSVLARAEDEKKRRLESALPLLEDSGFCFMQVKI